MSVHPSSPSDGYDRTQDPQYSKTALLKNLSTQKPQYSKTAVLKNLCTQNHSTQKPQYSKTAVLKNLCTQKPQCSKTSVLKIRSNQKLQFLKYDSCNNKFNCLKFSNHPSKSLYYLCVSHGSLRKSITMVYKFHSVRIVKLFSKPQNFIRRVTVKIVSK